MSYVTKAVTVAFAGIVVLHPTCGLAAGVTHYDLVAGTIHMQITAPRADILRIRMGEDRLPEDSSWAVADIIRHTHTQMDVREAAGSITLSTPALTITIDRATLRTSIADPAGRIVLADTPGAGTVFEKHGFRLSKSMPADEHYFGLGDKVGPLDRRDEAFTLWNTDPNASYQPSTDPLYKSIPFVLGASEAGQAFGFFLDNTWRTSFDFGKSQRDAMIIGAEGGPVDTYVMAGPTPKAVVTQYAFLTGTPPLPPLWSLGFQQSHWSYATQAEALAIAAHLRADHIPADALYLDIDYQDRNRPFTVNTKTFPDLPGLVARLQAEKFHLILITDLHIASAPRQGYTPYDSGIASDEFLKNPDGSVYVGNVWPGAAVFPDFSRVETRAWWGGLYQDFARVGVAGFWNDMNEPSIFDVRSRTMPLDTVHRIAEPGFVARTASHAEMHNVYGMLNARATFEGLLKLRPDQRPFVLTRAAYAGAQRYAATWTGDNLSTWAHLRLSVATLANLGLSGFAYSGDDIGGFAGLPPSTELLTRWFEMGAFNPIFRDHYNKGKAPQEAWVGGVAQEDIRRRYIEERYRLMPYIYALADENTHDGLPLLRPVFLEFPNILAKETVLGSQDQFMLGPDLLISPSPAAESPGDYDITLPGPGWFDYWTGKRLQSASVRQTSRLANLPIFVRPGAIIPYQPLVQSTATLPTGPLTFAIYPDATCPPQTLYVDDGTSLAYQRGDYLRQSVSCGAGPGGLTVHFTTREGSHHPWWQYLKLIIYGQERPASAMLEGKAIPSLFDARAATLTLTIPDIATAADLLIK